jgi:hypothetical protein
LKSYVGEPINRVEVETLVAALRHGRFDADVKTRVAVRPPPVAAEKKRGVATVT